jgi:hypothetical protein
VAQQRGRARRAVRVLIFALLACSAKLATPTAVASRSTVFPFPFLSIAMGPAPAEPCGRDGVYDFLDVFAFTLEKTSLAGARGQPHVQGETAGTHMHTLTHIHTHGGHAGNDSDEEVRPVDALDQLEGQVLDALDVICTATGPSEPPEPLDRDHLKQCYYLHGLFEESFMDLLGALAEELPGDTASNNMAAVCVCVRVTHARILACTHACIHTCIHMHTHTYTFFHG